MLPWQKGIASVAVDPLVTNQRQMAVVAGDGAGDAAGDGAG